LWTIRAVTSTYRWDIFCRVIDNLGDIGVCWRLAADLASRGHRIRLWVDDPAALGWMAPGALEGQWPGVQVLHWAQASHAPTLAQLPPAEVWIEGFGCEPPAAFVASRFAATAAAPADLPVWINLEYLSAEAFAARSHGLPSPLGAGPARGHTRWFFYPGLTEHTGGLLREPDLENRRARFDRGTWLAHQGIAWQGERLVSLFCYEPPALPALLGQLQQGAQPTLLLVAAGRGAAAVRSHLALHPGNTTAPGLVRRGNLGLAFLPYLTQPEFDHLLWASDLNHVRGEDSLVRAVWAGKAFVWQIYPQGDQAHHAKLDAMLDALDVPPAWRNYHRAWNGIGTQALPDPPPLPWEQAVGRARSSLLAQHDLSQRLCVFVERVALAQKAARKQS
jgi:uncharacterized repeat protein (TIGR03837 family)